MKKVERLFAAISGVSLAIVFVVALAQVVQRYVFNLPLPWATDVVRIFFIYSVFSGMCVGVIRNSHLNIDVLLQIIPQWARSAFGVISNVIVTVFLAVVLRYSIPFIRNNADQYTPYIEYPMSYVYLVFPVTAAVMIIFLLINTFSLLTGKCAKPKGGGV